MGAIYTFKLAVHYFRRSPQDADRDRCFIFIGSIAGILDNLVFSDAFALAPIKTDDVVTGELGVFRGQVRAERSHENRAAARLSPRSPSELCGTVVGPAQAERISRPFD